MITLPFSFDTTKYVRLGAYAMLVFPLLSIALELGEWLTAGDFYIPTLISLIVRSAVGIGITLLFVHFMLKYLNPARGTLSRAYVALEPFKIHKLGNALSAGNYSLHEFKCLQLTEVSRKREITISGKRRLAYWLSLVWRDESRWPITVMISSESNAREKAIALAQELGLPLEEK